MRLACWADPRYPMSLRARRERAVDAATMGIANHVPRRLAYFCTIRVLVNATTGEHSDQVVPDLLAMDALQRWR